MIWKDYLKLSEIASYSKLARASKVPPPNPRRNRDNVVSPSVLHLRSGREASNVIKVPKCSRASRCTKGLFVDTVTVFFSGKHLGPTFVPFLS